MTDDCGLKPVLSVAEVAAFLGVNVKTVYQAIQEQGLPAKRINRRRLVILRDALIAWLSSQAQASEKEAG